VLEYGFMVDKDAAGGVTVSDGVVRLSVWTVD
jgi:hypothetical protein